MNTTTKPKTSARRPRSANLSDRIRTRKGRLVKECAFCTCPDGCACSLEDPCACGSAKYKA